MAEKRNYALLGERRLLALYQSFNEYEPCCDKRLDTLKFYVVSVGCGIVGSDCDPAESDTFFSM